MDGSCPAQGGLVLFPESHASGDAPFVQEAGPVAFPGALQGWQADESVVRTFGIGMDPGKELKQFGGIEALARGKGPGESDGLRVDRPWSDGSRASRQGRKGDRHEGQRWQKANQEILLQSIYLPTRPRPHATQVWTQGHNEWRNRPWPIGPRGRRVPDAPGLGAWPRARGVSPAAGTTPRRASRASPRCQSHSAGSVPVREARAHATSPSRASPQPAASKATRLRQSASGRPSQERSSRWRWDCNRGHTGSKRC